MSCEGKGTRSRWIEVRTPRDASTLPPADAPAAERGQPGSPTVTLVQSFATSIFVSWSAPSEGGEVVGYKVGYSDGIPDLNWRYVSGAQRNITIDHLRTHLRIHICTKQYMYGVPLIRTCWRVSGPSTEYVISLSAFNSHSKGEAVYELVTTKDEG